jgi:4-amino-4-deoxy-L-arabinose transferase-like glycosyltransferase
VLGLHGRYDLKPPLYFATVKAVSVVAPEAIAGRLLSLVTGTLTVMVLYALAVRLIDRRAALVAAVLLALSPLHLWYSQEARMYAPSVLLVGLSYLALVALLRGETRRWAFLQGVAVLLALYMDYSAAYALAPQGYLLILLARQQRRRALAAWAATVSGLLGFLAWVPQVFAAAQSTGTGLSWYLGVSLGKIGDSLLAIVGLSGGASYYWGPVRTPWVRWPIAHPAFLLIVAFVAFLGLAALFRTRLTAATAVLGLLGGTIGTATLISLVSPGYADRTVLYAVLGWSLLAGAAASRAVPARARAAGLAGVGILAVASLLGVGAIFSEARKQDYRTLATAAIRADTTGYPLVVNDDLTDVAIDVYRRGPPAASPLRPAAITRQLASVGAPPPAFWYVYGDFPWTAPVRFDTLGYERRMHRDFGDGLFLDFYARPGVPPGVPDIDRITDPGAGENDALDFWR